MTQYSYGPGGTWRRAVRNSLARFDHTKLKHRFQWHKVPMTPERRERYEAAKAFNIKHGIGGALKRKYPNKLHLIESELTLAKGPTKRRKHKISLPKLKFMGEK